MRQPNELWHVYGAAIYEDRPSSFQRVSFESLHEEGAWQYAITCRLKAIRFDVVIVHTTWREWKGRPGHWRPNRKVIWRSGEGRAWFE